MYTWRLKDLDMGPDQDDMGSARRCQKDESVVSSIPLRSFKAVAWLEERVHTISQPESIAQIEHC